MLLGDAAVGDTVAADGDAGILVLAADNTVEMANRAADHWLDKSGASSRGELIARLFFDHYAPRLTATTESSASPHTDAACFPGQNREAHPCSGWG
jgi:hypothetical protein